MTYPAEFATLREALALSDLPQIHLVAYRDGEDSDGALAYALAGSDASRTPSALPGGVRFGDVYRVGAVTVADLRGLPPADVVGAARWFNANRDTLLARLPGPIVLVLGGDAAADFGRAAPDFWSCLSVTLADPSP